MQKEKDKMGLKDYLNDPKYRARIILLFYLMLFIAIIIWFRSIPKPKLNPNNNLNNNTNQNENNEEIEKKGPFSLIAGNNFSFEYILIIDNSKTTSAGKKYLAKEEFETSSNIDVIIVEYYADGMGVKGRQKTEGEVKNSYINMNKPYLYIDYFNTSILEKIINNATPTEKATILTISNEKLCTIVGCPSKMDDGTNRIELEMKNNYIVGIRMNYSAFSTALKPYYTTVDFSSSTFELKYSDFNLIDDFAVKN